MQTWLSTGKSSRRPTSKSRCNSISILDVVEALHAALGRAADSKRPRRRWNSPPRPCMTAASARQETPPLLHNVRRTNLMATRSVGSVPTDARALKKTLISSGDSRWSRSLNVAIAEGLMRSVGFSSFRPREVACRKTCWIISRTCTAVVGTPRASAKLSPAGPVPTDGQGLPAPVVSIVVSECHSSSGGDEDI